jgi:hypothetical protein
MRDTFNQLFHFTQAIADAERRLEESARKHEADLSSAEEARRVKEEVSPLFLSFVLLIFVFSILLLFSLLSYFIFVNSSFYFISLISCTLPFFFLFIGV